MATQNDKAVLHAIFNPLNPHSGPDEEGPEASANQDDQTPVNPDVKRLELEGVRAAEGQDWSRALSAFSMAIELDPSYASAYNNRAQLRRLMSSTSTSTPSSDPTTGGDNLLELALEDIETAITLSGGRGRVGRQALCQRALIQRLQGQEQQAIQDFQTAAQLGSKFAKDQLVELNPYAALCNKMLRDMFEKVRGPAN